MAILLLTKSLSYEREFVHNLNDLGHEVLCSNEFLINLQLRGFLGIDLNHFDSLILSETISDYEVNNILSLLLRSTCSIYRKTLDSLSTEAINYWKSQGISGVFSRRDHFDVIREELIGSNKGQRTFIEEPSVNEEVILETLLRDFSKQEAQVFRILQNSANSYISREALSEQLWGGAQTKSKESRLSGIISNIKNKIKNLGLDDTCLKTSWGRGYCLEKLQLSTNNKFPNEFQVIEA